jgi:CRISPR-associated protein Csd1
MLHRLVQYADDHGISGQEGYATKRIRFLFVFSPEGEFISVVQPYGRSGEEFEDVPNLQFSGDVPLRQFLVDTIDFLALFPNSTALLRADVEKLLEKLSEEPDYDVIKSLSDEVISLFEKGCFADLRDNRSEQRWRNHLLSNGRSEKREVKDFLKVNSAFNIAFNRCEFKTLELAESCKKLLMGLTDEPDFDAIQFMTTQVLSALKKHQYLELREQEVKKAWEALLKKRSRGKRPELRAFLKKNGPVDTVFTHPEFKLIGKHQFCLRLLEQAAEVDPVFGMIAQSMNDPVVLEKIYSELNQQTPAPKNTNNATFAVLSNDELRILVKDDCWRSWWESKQEELSSNRSALHARCLLSGDQIHPMLKHPKVKGLGGVGGKAETLLVSYNKESMESYGLKQGENAAISAESAVKYATAINRLLHKQHQLLAGTEIVYWYTKDIPISQDVLHVVFDGLGDFVEDDEVIENTTQREAEAHIDARKFLRSVKTGERHDFKDVEYCALTLEGNEGRAVVQNWMEGQFVDLAGNIDQWFSDLEIVRLAGDRPAKLPKLETVLTCLLKEQKHKQKYSDWVKPVSGFRNSIWRAAIDGKAQIPENTIRLILQRIRESMLTEEWGQAVAGEGEFVGMRLSRLYARMGLIKAYLRRNHNQEVDMADPGKNQSSVYWLGALFAELANLQREAHKTESKDNVNSTVVDRFYSTASTCPKLVHGRLIALSQHHLRKLDGKNSRAASAIKNKIAEISQKIDFEEVPDLLPLSDQSLFALGYYQQIAKSNHEKAVKGEKKRADAEAKAKALANKEANLTTGENK